MVSLVGRPVILFSSLLVLRLVTATLTNRTIDDEKGDSVSGLLPEYSPPGAWHQGSTCTACFVHLDSSQTFDGTWHDTTQSPGEPEPRSITMRFNGTAVYIYNALANTVQYADTGTYLTFTLDGSLVGRYQHVPRNTTLFDYNIPVYTNKSLQNEEHQLIVQADGNVQSPSLILFDYVVYTFDDAPSVVATATKNPQQPNSTSPARSSSSPQSPPPTAAIIGGAVGGIAALLALVGISVFICMRRRRRNSVHIRVIGEKPRRGKKLPRLSILGSELGPSSGAMNDTPSHSSKYPMGITPTDVESQDHAVGISQHSLIPLLNVNGSANSSRVFHDGQESSRSHMGSTALESPGGAYLFGGKFDVNIAAEGSDRAPNTLPPASPADPPPHSKRPPKRETAALRSQIAALQKEVEQLREQRKTVANPSSDDGDSDAPPPEYDGLGDIGHQ